MLLKEYIGRWITIDERVLWVEGFHAEKPCVVIQDDDGNVFDMPAQSYSIACSEGRVSEPGEKDFRHFVKTANMRAEESFRTAVLDRVRALLVQHMTWRAIRDDCADYFQCHPKYRDQAIKFPAVRTLQHWLQHASTAGLHDKRYLSGNRRPRHSLEFEDIVLDLLDQDYLDSDHMTLTTLARRAAARYLKDCSANERNPGAYGRKVVESILDSLPFYVRIRRRLGKEDARQRLLQATAFQKVKRPLDRIEIDSTRADIFVVIDEEGNVDRPWIMIAIDAATGFIVGLRIMLWQPTAIDTVLTLLEVMRPTDEAFFDKYEIQNRIQTYGTPLTIISDQGSENHGDAINRLVQVSKSEFERVRPKCPEKKPVVERANRTVSDFLTGFYGSTKSAELKAKERTKQAMLEAYMTLEDLEFALQQWRYDSYGMKPRRKVESPFKIAESPTRAWDRIQKETLLPCAPRLQDLNALLFSRRETRTLHHYGIENGKVIYWSEALNEYSKRTGAKSVIIWINPTDIRSIAVEDAKTREQIYVTAKDPDIPAITTEERDRILASVKIGPEEYLNAERVNDAIHKRVHHDKKKRRTKQAKARDIAAKAKRDKDMIARSQTPPISNADIFDQFNGDEEMSLPDRPVTVTRRRA